MFRAVHTLPRELELAPVLTAVEKDVIRSLQVDGRTPYARIAGDLGVSEKTVRLCVEQLRARGVIHITTVVDPQVMGYQLIALLGIRVDPSYAITEVADLLATVPGAFYVAMVSGRFNVVVELYCTDAEGLITALDQFVRPIAGITSIEIFPYLRLQYRFPAFDAAQRKTAGSHRGMSARLRSADISDTDKRIIAVLYEDGRASFRAVARELGISEAQVRRRVTGLIDAGALRIMALTVPAGVGFHTAAFVMISIEPGSSVEATATLLSELPAVVYVAICAGSFDILVEAMCTDREELLRLLDQDIRQLPGVRDVETSLHMRLHYRVVRPSEFLDVT